MRAKLHHEPGTPDPAEGAARDIPAPTPSFPPKRDSGVSGTGKEELRERRTRIAMELWIPITLAAADRCRALSRGVAR